MKIRILGARFSPDNLDHDKTSEDKNTFDISKRVVNNITGSELCPALPSLTLLSSVHCQKLKNIVYLIKILN